MNAGQDVGRERETERGERSGKNAAQHSVRRLEYTDSKLHDCKQSVFNVGMILPVASRTGLTVTGTFLPWGLMRSAELVQRSLTSIGGI